MKEFCVLQYDRSDNLTVIVHSIIFYDVTKHQLVRNVLKSFENNQKDVVSMTRYEYACDIECTIASFQDLNG